MSGEGGIVKYGVLVLLFVLQVATTFVVADENVCTSQPWIIVKAGDSATVAEVCQSSQKALTFLAQLRLYPIRKIYIEIVEHKIDSHGYVAYGSYDLKSDRILLMSYDAILHSQERPEMYGEFFDRVHYSGAIAHEITHAVFQHNVNAVQPGTSAQEYLAHVTQLAVLPQERRESIIRAMDVDGWASGDTISDIYMAINPGRFAVKSYLHFTALVDPAPFVHILLNAKWFYVSVP